MSNIPILFADSYSSRTVCRNSQGKWVAQYYKQQQIHKIGEYKTFEEAQAAYKEFKKNNVRSNNTSGKTGISRHQHGWLASVHINGHLYSKSFSTFEEAVLWRDHISNVAKA